MWLLSLGGTSSASTDAKMSTVGVFWAAQGLYVRRDSPTHADMSVLSGHMWVEVNIRINCLGALRIVCVHVPLFCSTASVHGVVKGWDQLQFASSSVLTVGCSWLQPPTMLQSESNKPVWLCVVTPSDITHAHDKPDIVRVLPRASAGRLLLARAHASLVTLVVYNDEPADCAEKCSGVSLVCFIELWCLRCQRVPVLLTTTSQAHCRPLPCRCGACPQVFNSSHGVSQQCFPNCWHVYFTVCIGRKAH